MEAILITRESVQAIFQGLSTVSNLDRKYFLSVLDDFLNMPNRTAVAFIRETAWSQGIE